jgi:Glycosyltransferase Family 4
MKPLRVLITNLSLDGRTGTETYTRDLALGLRSAGHQPVVYSPRLGKLAEELRGAEVPVSNDLASLATPDLIHGHHNLPLALAMLRFPGTPAIFVCHDARAWHDQAPAFAAVHQYVAVDFLCRDRLKADGIVEERIRVIGNSVDLDRFQPRGALPTVPRRALLFSNYATEHTHLRPVHDACAQAGLHLDVRGYGVKNVCENPEAILGGYDIVFAKARCAMEAMACGAAVVLCGMEGAGPLVTSGEFDALRDYNFGRHVLQQPLKAEYLLTQIARYDPADAQKVTQLARAKLGLAQMVDQWTELYGSLPPPAHQPNDAAAIARLLLTLESRLFQQTQSENTLAWLEAEHTARSNEQIILGKKLRNAVRLHGVLKYLWKFPPTRALVRMLGARELAS